MKIILWGKVKNGAQRGGRLGFPTANFPLHKNIPQGIYISVANIDKQLFHSLTFIGNAKTYNSKTIQAECYILDFNKDIYGKWISVELLKKLRKNIKFNSEEKLVQQIKIDLANAKKYFKIT